jgi:lactate dehydrogenase-like 2-hydroxyacid dehydrogenase
MKKIIVPQPLGFYPDQIERLKKLGEVKFYNEMASSPDEWLERVENADVICTGKFGLKQKIYDLKNTFLALPFVGIGWIDVRKIKEKNITVSFSPGCNKDAVSEWVMFVILSLFRNFTPFVRNNTLEKGTRPDAPLGLTDKKVTVLGKGNVGSRVGKLCGAFDMKVSYFKRRDSLLESIKKADLVIDCLSHNSTTEGLLNLEFFKNFKKGSYFITVTSAEIWDVDAMIKALDQGILAGVGTDAASIQFGDIYDPFYQKLLKHPKF